MNYYFISIGEIASIDWIFCLAEHLQEKNSCQLFNFVPMNRNTQNDLTMEI